MQSRSTSSAKASTGCTKGRCKTPQYSPSTKAFSYASVEISFSLKLQSEAERRVGWSLKHTEKPMCPSYEVAPHKGRLPGFSAIPTRWRLFGSLHVASTCQGTAGSSQSLPDLSLPKTMVCIPGQCKHHLLTRQPVTKLSWEVCLFSGGTEKGS